MVSQFFCPVNRIVNHRNSRGRVTTDEEQEEEEEEEEEEDVESPIFGATPSHWVTGPIDVQRRIARQQA